MWAPGTHMQDADQEVLDYEDTQDLEDKGAGAGAGAGSSGDAKKGHSVGVHSSGFRDFMLKPEILRAVVDCAFEHPSEGR